MPTGRSKTLTPSDDRGVSITPQSLWPHRLSPHDYLHACRTNREYERIDPQCLTRAVLFPFPSSHRASLFVLDHPDDGSHLGLVAPGRHAADAPRGLPRGSHGRVLQVHGGVLRHEAAALQGHVCIDLDRRAPLAVRRSPCAVRRSPLAVRRSPRLNAHSLTLSLALRAMRSTRSPVRTRSIPTPSSVSVGADLDRRALSPRRSRSLALRASLVRQARRRPTFAWS